MFREPFCVVPLGRAGRGARGIVVRRRHGVGTAIAWHGVGTAFAWYRGDYNFTLHL